MKSKLFKRIDEVADIANWIISAHGVCDLKISDAVNLTRNEIVKNYDGEKDKKGNLVPLDVFMMYYYKDQSKYVRSDKQEEFIISLSSADILGLSFTEPITIISAPPEGYTFSGGISFEYTSPQVNYTTDCDPIYLIEGNPIEGDRPLEFKINYI